jgi:tryptophan synthase alpha chain
MTDKLNRIDETFARLDVTGRKGLLPFITAGFPDAGSTGPLLAELDQPGVVAVEVGFPFSDPIADGPTIQSSFYHALAGGLKIASIFDSVRRFRSRSQLPTVAMVSHSIVYRQSPEAFIRRSAEAGFDGLIIPDLPAEEAEPTADLAAKHGLCLIMMAAPTTAPSRRPGIARLSSGFLYYMAVTGVTGERQDLAADLARQVGEWRSLTDLPICVGFGISTADHVRRVTEVADGAIVGSALIRRLLEGVEAGEPRAKIVARAGALVRELAAGLPTNGDRKATT